MKYFLLYALFLVSFNTSFAQNIQIEKEEGFVPFNSLRFEASGGGSNLKYQNKKNTQISTSSSKKLMNFNIKWVRLSSPNFRWYVAGYFEDYSFDKINSKNELSLSPAFGLSYSISDGIHITGEVLAYQHLEMESNGDLIRKLDPALRFDWKIDAIKFSDNDVIGIGQNYTVTIPTSQEQSSNGSSVSPDYDISSQIFYRNVYLKNTLEFYLNHQYKIVDSPVYKLEMNNVLIGIRFALPFQ